MSMKDSKYTLARFNIQQRITDRNWRRTSTAAADKEMKLVQAHTENK